MKVQTISQTYTYFGNFSKLNSKDAELRKAFEGYNVQTGKEKLPNGVEVNVFRVVKENTAVTIHAYRIDCEYGYNNPECSSEKFIAYAEDATKKIATIENLKGQRIAYSNVEFVENNDGAILKNSNKAFNIAGVYGEDACELNVRVNHIKEINGEKYNSVVVMQDGKVTNNSTHEENKAVFINKDINTLIVNREERFSLENTASYLGDMI
ncbi:MAG: hypothetical protein HP024_04220, partial [Acholeplasmatales bacterium]|nr:hypothetical protein [Acholeplasmatales bacterium]